MKKQISTIAKTYADGIIEYSAGDISKAERILYNLKNIQLSLNSSEELHDLLKNPAIDFSKKIEIINEIFKSELDEHEKNILKMLIEKQRFNEFENIVEALKVQIQKIKGEKEIFITSAIALDDDEKLRIISKLETKFQSKVLPIWKEDKEILGGLVIQTDDDIIDMSLLNKITNLSKNIIK